MKINKIVPSIMIAASSIAGCSEHAPRKMQTTLSTLMANKPAKEYMAIKAGWREGLAKDADAQHSLDSVAFRRIIQKSFNYNDTALYAKFNQIFAQTKLKNTKSYQAAFEELDKKIIEEGVTTAKHESNLAEYKGLQIIQGPLATPNNPEILKLRQFKLDSLAFKNFYEKNNILPRSNFEKIASDIKPQ